MNLFPPMSPLGNDAKQIYLIYIAIFLIFISLIGGICAIIFKLNPVDYGGPTIYDFASVFEGISIRQEIFNV